MNQRVRELMTREVLTVGPEWKLADIARVMRDENIGAVPVAEDNQLVGIITDRDLVVRGFADGGGAANERTARDVMSANLFYCFDDQAIEEVLRLMSEQQVRRLPVIDRRKRLVGMVSFSDLTGAAEIGFGGSSGAYRRLSRAGLH